jgi:hypothetical protein
LELGTKATGGILLELGTKATGGILFELGTNATGGILLELGTNATGGILLELGVKAITEMPSPPEVNAARITALLPLAMLAGADTSTTEITKLSARVSFFTFNLLNIFL